jgi:hypothetical protein
MKRGLVLTAGCFIAILFAGCDSTKIGADSNKEKFYIFLCFGQSNMEGYPGTIQEQDKTVDSRFQMLAAVDFPQMNRVKGTWYDAVPPLCRPGCGLCPADYFGRTLVANLPENIKVGVINVAVAGCKIECFEKDSYQEYVSTSAGWLQDIVKQYNGNPYQYLVDLGKKAQAEGGIIKGILLHQGESNSGDRQWPAKVKGIYDNLITDLNLKAEETPLLVGQLVNGGMSQIMAELPKQVPNAHIIPSNGCGQIGVHFNSQGYRLLGTRYGEKMTELLGYEVKKAATEPVASL